MKIVLTGGGTAGHVIPNLALLPNLEKYFSEIHYIGSHNGIENEIIRKNKKITYHKITTVKLIRAITFKNLLIPFKLIKGIFESKKILKKIKPDIVFSKGGYVSVPVALAAKRLKIPIIAHESDFSIGLANKIIYKLCKKMCFSFNNIPKNYKAKGIFTGSPIRRELMCKKNLNTNCKKTLLFIGGSLGAKKINEFVFNNIKKLTNKYNVIHITGKNKNNRHLENIVGYTQIDFTDKIEDVFGKSDIVISRAGSNTIFELLALLKPMILIPLPKEESRGDQIENANYFKENGFANVIEQKNLTLENFCKTLNDIIKNERKIVTNMKKNRLFESNNLITKIILENCKKTEKNN